jgi:hypothetical protein
MQEGNAQQALANIVELDTRCGALPTMLYALWSRLLAACDETEKAFAVLLRGLNMCALNPENDCHARGALAGLCAGTWAWADDQQLPNYLRACRATLCAADLHNAYMEVARALQLLRVVLPAEQRLRAALQLQDWAAAQTILSSVMASSTQEGHGYQRAIVYAALGKTNGALNAISNMCVARMNFCTDLGTNMTVTLGRYATLQQQLMFNVIATTERERK